MVLVPINMSRFGLLVPVIFIFSFWSLQICPVLVLVPDPTFVLICTRGA